MSKFIEALKEKYGSPAEVMKALGMDPAVLAMDEEPKAGLSDYDKTDHPHDAHGKFKEKSDAGGEGGESKEGGGKPDKAKAAFSKLKELANKGKGEDMAKKAKDELDGNSGIPVVGGGKRKAMDAEQMKDFLKDKVSEDDMKALDAMCKDMKDCDEEEAMDKKAKDEFPPEKEKDKAEDTVTRAAMDEAIKVATKVAHDSAIKTQRDIQLALDAVNPFVGKLAMAFDSAGEVYRKALTMMKVDVSTVKDDAALPIILKSQPLPGAVRHLPKMAADSATGNESFTKLFGDVRPSINL